MGWKDAREWIAALEDEGELRRCKTKVDWDGEIAEIVIRVISKRGPAILFENIKDYEQGRCTKLLVGAVGSRKRVAMALGLEKDTSRNEIIHFLRKKFNEAIEPTIVDNGPVKDNIVMGDKINLFDFPVPMWHPDDGGRYINTFCGIITKDPETGERNVGLYRGMILDGNRIGVFLVPAQHWGIHYSKYKAMNKPMPVAIAYNWDPVMELVASNSVRDDEYNVMGAIRGEPVELTKCETSDLEVPAATEIVVEGSISPNQNAYEVEGPFGEWSGYYGEARRRPVIEVECITHRNSPIFRGQREGVTTKAMGEGVYAAHYGQIALLWNALEDAGIPGVVDVALGSTTIVKIRKMYEGHAKRVAAALWASQSAIDLFKIVTVVEDDVDISNLRDVERAVMTNVDPDRDLTIFPGTFGPSLDVSLSEENRDELVYGAGNVSRLLIDATVSWKDHPPRKEWGNKRLPPKCTDSPPEIVQLVDKRWREYGID
jgi:4-hydroxy-3-polyprenylbenzoate decarboxylase